MNTEQKKEFFRNALNLIDNLDNLKSFKFMVGIRTPMLKITVEGHIHGDHLARHFKIGGIYPKYYAVNIYLYP